MDRSRGRRYTEEYPELGTGPVPVAPYVSPEYFERERERIFRRTWLHVGREQEIPKPGDFLVRSLEFANASILIVRSEDGRIRAFHNVCAHRGNKLVWDRAGRCRGFTCKYHGWTYGSDGRLVGLPEEDMFFDFNKNEIGLTPVQADLWNGFIFINLSERPDQTLREHIGEVDELVSGYPFERLSACFSYRTRLRANWKVLVDSQQEGYHAKVLHRRSLPGFLTNRANPSQHVVDIRLFEKNRLISYFGNRDAKPSPTAMKAYQYGPSVGKFQEGLSANGLNPANSPDWAFDEYVIFPNLQLLLFAGMFITHTMRPVSVNESIWEARAYLPPASTIPQKFSLEHTKVLLRDAWLEDGSTLEATQGGLESGAITHQILQDQEVLIRHASKVIDVMVGAA